MSRSRLIALAASMALALAACAEEAPPAGGGGATPEPTFTTIQEGILQVGSCLDYPPFESVKAGDEVGFDVDLAEEIASRLGLEVEWVRAEFDTIFTAVAGGQFDMVAAASTITEEREQIVDFSDGYYNSRQSLAVNVEETPDIASSADLGEGDTVGVQKGTTGKDYAEENLAPQGVEIKTFTSATDAFRDLEAGNIAGVINDEPSSVEIVKDLTGVEVVEPIDTGEVYGFALSPDNPDLTEAVNGALGEIIADGTYAEIFGRYFPGVEVPPEFQPTA